MISYVSEKHIKTVLSNNDAYVFTIAVKDVLPIYYVAVRGIDDVEGAVQRVLNRRRISLITDFVLEGNMFFNTFILNWTNIEVPLVINGEIIKIPTVPSAAQVIDGQHRLEGLKLAYDRDASVGENRILIVMVQNITTHDAAKIFLNINSEQKPVPQSLIYDLFGEFKEKDYPIVRATDIADRMHGDVDSPYYQSIKKPGAPQGVGKVDLSTVVSALKNYSGPDGVFSQYNLNDMESQYKVINNFFEGIRFYYEKEGAWLKSQNPFMTSAGFFAAIKFLCEDLIPKCAEQKSFEIATIKRLLPIDVEGLIKKDDIKNMQGKEQREVIYKYLKKIIMKEVPKKNDYKF